MHHADSPASAASKEKQEQRAHAVMNSKSFGQSSQSTQFGQSGQSSLSGQSEHMSVRPSTSSNTKPLLPRRRKSQHNNENENTIQISNVSSKSEDIQTLPTSISPTTQSTSMSKPGLIPVVKETLAPTQSPSLQYGGPIEVDPSKLWVQNPYEEDEEDSEVEDEDC